MIKLQNISKSYGDLIAVNNLSLEIERGEIHGVVGLSGAGKSTLVRLINRLEDWDSGRVFIDNREITGFTRKELSELRKGIGMIFQSFNLLNSRSVKGNIALPLELLRWKKSRIDKRVKELLDLVGLKEKIDSNISQLSGGQKQRVAIARALASGPGILLCDEATSALDPQTTKSILSLIKDIQKRLNLTVVIITHQMEVVRDICNRVSIMKDGEIIESGDVEVVFANPERELTKEFVYHLRKEPAEEILYSRKEGFNLIKLHFNSESAEKPIIYNLIKRSSGVINILSGDILKLTTSKVGELVIEVESRDLKKIKEYLEDNNVNVEVINVS